MIGIIYFNEKLEESRKHHQVNDEMMESWLYFYQKSGTTIKPCLLTDEKTDIPRCWTYNVVRLQDSEPPTRRDVLNKVGWMKAQAHTELGRCIVMDLDCMILQNIDDLEILDTAMAMPVDPSKRTYNDWPEVGEELNAGTMFFNQNTIWARFKELWDDKKHYMKITYFDEIIFSAICRELGGTILDVTWNGSWTIGNDKEMFETAKTAKILHFHGKRKSQLRKFYEACHSRKCKIL